MSSQAVALYELDMTAIEIWQVRAYLELDLDETNTDPGTGEGDRNARLSGQQTSRTIEFIASRKSDD
jgi:hypothetical protein